MEANALNIRIHRFYEAVEPVRDKDGKPTGELKAHDMVDYGPPGQMDKLVVPARIERMKRAAEPDAMNQNPAMRVAWDRWKFIEPHYNAWKKGEELPQDGVPLAALNFLRAEDAAVLKRHGIKTAQDLRDMLDSDLSKVPLPAMREKRVQAKHFLEAQDTNKAAARIAAAESKADDTARELEALKAQMASFMAAKQDVDVDENGDRLPKKRKTLTMPQQAA
jgi:hypothetical protein